MHWYGMLRRGFSVGCQPMKGLIDWKDTVSDKYYSYLWYNRKLTDEEVKQYDLEYFGEVF